MSAPKFKVGDRVRLTESRESWGLRVGATGTVVENDSTIPFVEWDNFTEGHSGPFGDGRTTCLAANMDNLQLIQPTPTAESLLLALGKATHELEAAEQAKEAARKAFVAACTRREDASNAYHKAQAALQAAAREMSA